MPTNTRTQIKVIVNSLTRFTENLVKALTLNVTANLREDNPVDTGWSRANWLNAIGRRVTKPIGSKESVDVQAQEATIAKVAASYTLNQGVIFISNNVSYIIALNDGTSKQAPRGFVQIAIFRAVGQTVAKVR
jgi:hypothetical protein